MCVCACGGGVWWGGRAEQDGTRQSGGSWRGGWMGHKRELAPATTPSRWHQQPSHPAGTSNHPSRWHQQPITPPACQLSAVCCGRSLLCTRTDRARQEGSGRTSAWRAIAPYSQLQHATARGHSRVRGHGGEGAARREACAHAQGWVTGFHGRVCTYKGRVSSQRDGPQPSQEFVPQPQGRVCHHKRLRACH